MCLCIEIHKQSLSLADWADRFGVDTPTVQALREWQTRTPCYCDKISEEMMVRTIKILELWLIAKRQNRPLEVLCEKELPPPAP